MYQSTLITFPPRFLWRGYQKMRKRKRETASTQSQVKSFKDVILHSTYFIRFLCSYKHLQYNKEYGFLGLKDPTRSIKTHEFLDSLPGKPLPDNSSKIFPCHPVMSSVFYSFILQIGTKYKVPLKFHNLNISSASIIII